MRFVQRDPVVRAWYRKKVARDGRLPRSNALVAVMRKLGMAIWHVVRGSPFDSRKLFDLKALGMVIRYRLADILRGRFDLPHRVNIAENSG